LDSVPEADKTGELAGMETQLRCYLADLFKAS